MWQISKNVLAQSVDKMSQTQSRTNTNIASVLKKWFVPLTVLNFRMRSVQFFFGRK